MKPTYVDKSDVQILESLIKAYLKVDMSIPRRKRPLVEARMVFYTILKELDNEWKAIARIYSKDHSTIINAVNQFYILSRQEPKLLAKYNLIKNAFVNKRGTHPLELKSRDALIDKVIKLESENHAQAAELKTTKNMLSLQGKYMPIMKLLDSFDIDGFEIDLVNTRLSSILATMHEKYRTQK